MISTTMARALRDAGLRWHPASGDQFAIESDELDGDIFTVSDMTIEPHEFDTGTILGFNGTTEWALDSIAIEAALWLPREDQLRALLGSSFRALTREDDGGYRVSVMRDEDGEWYGGSDAESAYAAAVLELIQTVTAPVE